MRPVCYKDRTIKITGKAIFDAASEVSSANNQGLFKENTHSVYLVVGGKFGKTTAFGKETINMLDVCPKAIVSGDTLDFPFNVLKVEFIVMKHSAVPS